MKQCITLASVLFVLFGFSQTNRIDSLTVKLAYQKQDSIKVETSTHLIQALYFNEQYNKALVYIDQTEKLAKQIDYNKGKADVFYYKALIYTKKDDYYNAINAFSKALSYYKEIDFRLGIAKVNNRIGLLEIKRGNYSTGLKNSLSAIDVLEKNNLANELSYAYNNLAEAYSKTRQLNKALEFNLKAMRVREDLRDTLGLIETNQNLANIYSNNKQHRKSIRYYENILDLKSSKLDKNLKAEILPSIGSEYLHLKNYEKAAEYLVDGLKLNRSIKNNDGIVRALNSVGQLNLEKGNLRLARIQANEANSIAKRTNNREQLLKNYYLQKEIDSAKRNFQNAFFWQSKYYELKDELDNENRENFLEIMDNSGSQDIELSERVASPSLESVENKEVPEEKNQASIIPYVLGGILFIAIAVIVFLLLFREKNLDDNPESETRSDLKLINERDKLLKQNINYAEQVKNLEEVNGIKDRLFSIVSHDLKDSVSSIKAFLDLIKEGNISEQEFRNLIPELSENADNAMELLFNLLNWSKSQMQNLEPKAEKFNIEEVFNNKVSLIEQKAQQKGVEIQNNSHRDYIYADRSMIEIVVQNLLTNAVKFTKAGDTISISNSDNYGKALITVADTGVGISKKDIDKLFKDGDFTTTGTSNEKGTGLGLTICKQLVELNNGKIWVESQVGVGTTFYVELPKMKAK